MKRETEKHLILVCLSAVFLLSAATAVYAQADADESATNASEDIVQSAGFIKKKLAELLLAMSDVANLLDKTEPDVAAILRRTVEHAQREDVSGKIEDVIRDIRQGLDQAAQIQQGEVIADLTQMLRILEGGVGELTKAEKHLAELQAIRDKLEKNLKRQELEEKRTRPAANLEEIKKRSDEFQQALQNIIGKQKSIKAETARIGHCDPELKKLGEILQAVEELAAKQKELGDTTDKAGLSRLPILAEAQKRLAGRAKTLPKEIEAIKISSENKEIKAAADLVKSASQQMEKSVAAMEKTEKPATANAQARALADLQAAGKRLRKILKTKGGDTPAGKLSEPQDQLAGQTGELAGSEAKLAEQAGIDPQNLSADNADAKGDLGKAADHMKNAAENLNAQQPAAAEAKQEKALDELLEQLRRITELKRRAMAQAEKDLNETEQKRIAEDLKKLAERMKGGDGNKAAAGSQAVAAAGKCAGSAAGKMSDGDAKSSNSEQKQAIDKLRKAQEELDEQIAQLERRIKAEKLASVEERLANILEQQKACNKQTSKTYDERSKTEPAYDRQAKQTLNGLAKTEGQLAEEVQSVRDMLKKDGSTVVFPEVLREVQEDLSSVQQQLAEADPGPLTQATQEDIVRTLEELVRAVRKELSKGHGRAMGGGGGGQGGGGGKAPLVPPVAELRMLRMQQLRVNAGTRRTQRMINAKQLTGQKAEAEYTKLAERQKRVTEMAEKMATKMKKERDKKVQGVE